MGPHHGIQELRIKPLLEVISATFVYGIATWVGAGLVALTCFLLSTKYWYVIAAYLAWIWMIDRHAPKFGKRERDWVRNCILWKYTRSYFSTKLITVPDFKLESTKNYLFVCHPHAVFPLAAAITFLNHGIGYWKTLVTHKFYYFTLPVNFLIPLYRDAILAMGIYETSPEAISHILGKPSGGNVGVIFPGGAAESINSYPGTYRIVLKSRKGFIKLALVNGASIVPVISFGELDVLYTVQNPYVRLMQKWVKGVTGIAPILFYGRGYLPIPNRTPIHVVVGAPINVTKVDDPSQEEIEALHNEYITRLTQLFEEEKYKYLKDAKGTTLIVE